MGRVVFPVLLREPEPVPVTVAPRLFGTRSRTQRPPFIAEILRRDPSPTGDFRDILRARWAEIPSTVPKGITIMARVIKPVATTNPSAVATAVPDDVAADLDGMWTHLQAHPEFVALAEFTDETTGEGDDAVTVTGAEQAETFIRQARAWAKRHNPELTFRKLAGKDLPDTAVKFTLRYPLTEAEKAEKAAKRKAKAEQAETPAETPETAETAETVKPGPARKQPAKV